MWREKGKDDREGYASKTGFGTGVGFGTENKRKNSMETRKKTREGIGKGTGICAIVGVDIGKGMNTGYALLLGASKGTGTRQDDGTGVGTDMDTSAISVSANDYPSGRSTGREVEDKGTRLGSSCFWEAGLQVSQQ